MNVFKKSNRLPCCKNEYVVIRIIIMRRIIDIEWAFKEKSKKYDILFIEWL
jgi:hypothetical protein